jgi:two-component system nitrogen regulation sensor histidine kinase NtrY
MPTGKRNIILIAGTFLFMLLLTFLEIYLQGVTISSRFITNNIIVFVVINIHIILLMVLVLLVLRNLTKLYIENRQRILGARFKTKLIVSFILLSSIPLLILFVGSLSLVNKSIHDWFDYRIEEVLLRSTEIADSYYQALGTTNLHFARRLAQGIETGRLLKPGAPERLMDWLGAREEEYNLHSATVFDENLGVFVGVARSGEMGDALPPPQPALLRKALQGEEATAVVRSGSQEYLRCFVPIAAGPRQARGVLVVSTRLPVNLGDGVKKISSTFENYRQFKILKNPIRFNYQIALAMITLLWIFMIIWFAFYLARFITVPIQHLAEATRRVSSGDLDYRITFKANDELGMLIDSFNNMTGDLQSNKAMLDTAYQRLERSNRELEGRKRYIETVLDNIATGVVSFDRTGRVTTVNKAARAMLRIGDTPLPAPHFRDLFGGESHREILSCLETLYGQTVNRVEQRIDIEGETTSLNLYLLGSSIRDEEGVYAGSVCVLENITELNKAQRIAAWREVARRIAHEIKNPLTPIKLSAQRIRKKFFQGSRDFDRVFDEGTQMIIEQVGELQHLVDEFSRFARMPSGRPSAVDIHQILATSVKLFGETYREVEFVTDFADHPLQVMADPEQMKRAFINLIDNAIDAVAQKGKVEIATLEDPSTRTVRILIKDDGTGIPPEIKDNLFTPYFSTKKEGTGLGLAIVSSIVTEHGGYIRVKPNVPRGTVFIIELPLHRGSAIPA